MTTKEEEKAITEKTIEHLEYRIKELEKAIKYLKGTIE